MVNTYISNLLGGAFHCVQLNFETLQRLGVYIILFKKQHQYIDALKNIGKIKKEEDSSETLFSVHKNT